MPTIGFRGAYVAAYTNTSGTVTYGAPISAGQPISAQLQIKFAEARLYAGDALAEYIREITGGSITFGAKYFPTAAQQIMFGATTKSRSVTIVKPDQTEETKNISSLVSSTASAPGYVGFAGYAPDLVDGASKFTCFFCPKVKFSQPNTNLNTKNDQISFQTPETTGEFLPDDTTGRVVQEVAVVDSEAEAIAWCTAVFPQPATTP